MTVPGLVLGRWAICLLLLCPLVWVGYPAGQAELVQAADEPREGSKCKSFDEGERVLTRPNEGKLDEHGKFQASIRIIQLECQLTERGKPGTCDLPEPPDPCERATDDEFHWKRVKIDLPVPKGRVRLTDHKNTNPGFGVEGNPAYYGRFCSQSAGLGWRITYRPESAYPEIPPKPAEYSFSTELTWRWNGRDVAGGRRYLCEPTDISAIQTHVLEEGKNGVLVQFPENYAQYDLAGAVAGRVRGYPYQQLVGIGMAPGPVAPALTGLRTYYWLEGLDQAPFNGDVVTVGPASAPLSAFILVAPREGRWDYGDSAPFSREILARRGLAWPDCRLPDGSPAPGAISYVYDRDGAFQLRASLDWSGRWAPVAEGVNRDGGTPIIVSMADNLPIFTAPSVTAEHVRPVVVKQARAFVRDSPPTPPAGP